MAYRSRRRRSILVGALTVGVGTWLACEAPDGSVLYEPLTPGGASGSAAGGVAAGGGSVGGSSVGGGAGSGVAPSGGRAGSGGAGSSGEAGAAGSGVDASAPLPDAGLDAGEDAAPAPVACAEPSAEVCDGVDNDCDGVVDPEPTCLDGCAGFVLAERAYMFCPEPEDRGIALARCEAQNMRLAWIEDEAENDALVLHITELGLADDDELITQIGASDAEDEDEWLWVGNGASPDGFEFWEGNSADDDGEPVAGAYQNWASVEPNDQNGEDCGVLSVLGSENRDPGEWDDRNCDEAFAFLCEVP